MTNIFRRLQNLDTIDALVQIGIDQMTLIQEQRVEMYSRELEHARNLRDLIVQFREQVEMPEEQVIPALDAAIVDLNDSVARLEEHVG